MDDAKRNGGRFATTLFERLLKISLESFKVVFSFVYDRILELRIDICMVYDISVKVLIVGRGSIVEKNMCN